MIFRRKERPSAEGDGSGDGPYGAYLKERGLPSDSVAEAEYLAVGPWKFYRHQAGTKWVHPAGFDDSGHFVDGAGPADWYEFLETPELDADGALERAAWLLLRPAPLNLSVPLGDERMQAEVGPPSLDRDAGSARLQGWIVYPPETSYPHRLTVRAAPGQRATIVTASWKKVIGE